MAEKWLQPYKPIHHATEDVRREKYKGAASRQVLRAILRKEAFNEITKQYPGESHHLRRSMAFDRAHKDYRRLIGLPERVVK